MDEQIITQFCDTNDSIDNKIFMVMAKKGKKKRLYQQRLKAFPRLVA